MAISAGEADRDGDDAPLPAPIPPLRRTLTTLRRNPMLAVGLLLVALIVAAALLAPLLAPFPGDAGSVVRFQARLRPPSQQYWLGTDAVGRDVLSRILMGARTSLVVAFSVIALSAVIGVPLGLFAGFLGGIPGAAIMRVNDVFLAIPSLVFVLVASAFMTPSTITTVAAISLAWWTWYARLAFGEVVSLRHRQFVDAARVAGASRWRIAVGEILPNLTSVLIVKITVDLGYVILLGASLGFLGLGVQPPEPEWGLMIGQGREQLPRAWWLVTFPGLAIVVTVAAFNLLGDGLADLLGQRND